MIAFRPRIALIGAIAALGVVSSALSFQDPKPDAAPKAEKPASKAKAKSKGTAKAEAEPDAKLETATFGGGCFWCLEAVFERIPGVKSVVSGYSGGNVPRPTYAQVCTGETGHAEVVQIDFDPEKVTYDKLLETFFTFHDPTTLNQQGPDFGTQYRSVIFYHSPAQKKASEAIYTKLTEGNVFPSPIVTDLVPFQKFWPADKHHQDYYRKNPNAAYCRQYIAPKVQKLLQHK